MKIPKSSVTLTVVFPRAAFTFSLAVCAHAQTVKFLTQFDGADGAGALSVIQRTDENFTAQQLADPQFRITNKGGEL